MKNKHFLITLFNLRLWSIDKSHIATHTDEWLMKRFKLFETYCLPSVQQQTTKEFIWLCLFDAETPQFYKNKIEKYCQQVPQLMPCYFTQEEMSNWEERLKVTIISLLNGAEFVITTKVDNDDSLHKKMLETIQETFNQEKKLGLYTYIHGLQYFPKTGLLLKMKYPHNHFLTYIEDAQTDLKTIVHTRHAEARKKATNIIDIANKPYWIEIVHANNVNNDLRITSRIHYSTFWKGVSLKDYGLDIYLNWKHNLYCNLITLPELFFKTAYKKLLRKTNKRRK